MRALPVFRCTNKLCGIKHCRMRRPQLEDKWCKYAIWKQVGVTVYKPWGKK